jgi:hypothetical protein
MLKFSEKEKKLKVPDFSRELKKKKEIKAEQIQFAELSVTQNAISPGALAISTLSKTPQDTSRSTKASPRRTVMQETSQKTSPRDAYRELDANSPKSTNYKHADI